MFIIIIIALTIIITVWESKSKKPNSDKKTQQNKKSNQNFENVKTNQNWNANETSYFSSMNKSFFDVFFDKGIYGEYRTFKELEKIKGIKKFLFNCYLPKSDGTTTEIDVIMIHDSGIYVFESKNYSGWIFGDESSKMWTQTLPKGRGRSHKSQFLNPIIQNKIHLKWLKKYLNDTTLPIYSIIVFGERCTLKNITLTTQESIVVNCYNLLNEVYRIANRNGPKISVSQINQIYSQLYPLTKKTYDQKQTHIRETRQKATQSYQAKAGNTCPRCGGNLVLRTANKGKYIGKQFKGCGNFHAVDILQVHN